MKIDGLILFNSYIFQLNDKILPNFPTNRILLFFLCFLYLFSKNVRCFQNLKIIVFFSEIKKRSHLYFTNL